MLQITDLTYRIQGRLLIDQANARIAKGWKVGLVGRNGTGKSTLLRLIREEADGRSIEINRGATLGFVAQEVAPTDDVLLDVVLAADRERAALMAEVETATDAHRIADIHSRLIDIDAYSAEARAAEILTGLGFTQEDLSRPTREFSGGWRMRAALGGVLFATPDLLLLDEPTNYLDLEGASWLEAHLRRYPNTVILVSHDREMLNRSVTHIMALDQAKLSIHPGGYDNYLRKRAEQAMLATAMKAKQDAERAHLQAFVDRFRAKASKARQAQSRVKMLEKIKEIAVPIADRTIPFHFESDEELASPLIQLDEADLGYGSDSTVLHKVSLRVDQDDRIAIVGANGQGKTTLVKSLAGKLALQGGTRRATKTMRIGYFSQDQLDELRAGETPLDHVRELRPNATPAALRSIAAQLGFGVQKIATKVESLSGGEKVRLLLGLIALNKPHLLIFDEPTSHLDIDSREALIYALNDYSGAVLLITHDVYLAEGCADRLWLVKDGRAAQYDGDLDDYRALIMAADRSPTPRQAAKSSPAPTPAPQPERKAEPPSRREPTGPLKKRVAEAERAMDAARTELARLDAELAHPEVGPRMRDLMRQRAAAEKRLATAEEDWLAASAALELHATPDRLG